MNNLKYYLLIALSIIVLSLIIFFVIRVKLRTHKKNKSQNQQNSGNKTSRAKETFKEESFTISPPNGNQAEDFNNASVINDGGEMSDLEGFQMA